MFVTAVSLRASAIAAMLLMVPPLASAQAPSVDPRQPARPASLPATTATGTVNPFLSGVPTGTLTAEPIKITAVDAVLRALDHNLGVLNAEEALGRAHGARWIALSQLLPNVSAQLSVQRQTVSLAAFGFGPATGVSFPGVPSVIGPFNVFDARIGVRQSVFDLESINAARAESQNVESARFIHQNARDFVINVAGNVFVQVLAASARAESARAQRETADALYKQAVSLRDGGLIAGVDVLRAQVELASQQQRATQTANDYEKLKLSLARLIGLPLGQQFTLDANLPELPAPAATLENAVELAYKTRPDYQAALAKVRAAELMRASIIGSNLPSVHVSADVGAIGTAISETDRTYTMSGAVSIPIFNGGKTHGKLLQANADIRARQTEADDLKASIYYDLRSAFLDLAATSELLRVATGARELARQQLTQTRDRFAAGVADNVEVIQAQEAVTVAEEQFISAQYGYDIAKGALIRGTGSSEQVLRQIIGGSR